MNHKMRLAGAATAVAAGGFSAVLLHFSRRWIQPVRVVLDAPTCDQVEETRFVSDDGTELYGWLLRAGRRDPALVLCHGYQRAIEETLSLGSELRARGFNVLLFDFRGCGRSGGKYTTIGHREPADALAAIRRLRELVGPETPIGMLGISMGGAAALSATALSQEVRALVSDSAFSTLVGAVQQRFRNKRFVSLQLHRLSMRAAEYIVKSRVSEVRPIDAARTIADRPVLLIHGTADQVVPFDHALELDAAIPGPHELWKLDGVPHAMARFYAPAEYVERVADFFRRHLVTELRNPETAAAALPNVSRA